jgi:hypothetical protein
MSLAVKVDAEQKLRTYTPESDFSIWINGFPRLVWEICSDPYLYRDKWRMRASGISIVKLGNCILIDKGKPPHFILVAIYQTAESKVHFSVLYEENGKVSQQLS